MVFELPGTPRLPSSGDMPQSRSSCSQSEASQTKKQKVTHVTAVYSDEWNSSFNPKHIRSRRRKFTSSGEKISGFTAVFCDEWRDGEEAFDDDTWLSTWENGELDLEFTMRRWDSIQTYNDQQDKSFDVDRGAHSAEILHGLLSSSASPTELLSSTATLSEHQTPFPVDSLGPLTPFFNDCLLPFFGIENNVNSGLMTSIGAKRTPIGDFAPCEERVRNEYDWGLAMGGFEVWGDFMDCCSGRCDDHGEKEGRISDEEAK